jgi:hypothetical protein
MGGTQSKMEWSEGAERLVSCLVRCLRFSGSKGSGHRALLVQGFYLRRLKTEVTEQGTGVLAQTRRVQAHA